MPITAITVTHNSADRISQSLACIYGDPDIISCIVVDNASTDATVELIRSQFPAVTLVANAVNEGFGRACNKALDMVTTEFALLINPDVAIALPAIRQLDATLRSHPQAPVVAPLIEDQPPALRLPFMQSQTQPCLQPTDEANIFTTGFVSGAVALWRMSHLRGIGCFDPAFFLFYEDDDLSYRTVKAGHTMLMMAGLPVEHRTGSSCALTPSLNSLKLRSSCWSYLYIYRKYQGRRSAYRQAMRMVTQAITRYFLSWAIRIKGWTAYVAALKNHARRYQQELKDAKLRGTAVMESHAQEIAQASETQDHQRWEKQKAEKIMQLETEWQVRMTELEKNWSDVQRVHHPYIHAIEQCRASIGALRAVYHFLRNPTYCRMVE